MNILKVVPLFILILNSLGCYPQGTKMDKEVEEYIALGKNAVIQLALKSVNELHTVTKKVTKEDFNYIRISTNGKEIKVLLNNSITYLPEKSMFYYGAIVHLLEKNARSINRVANPPDYSQDDIVFYTETKKNKKSKEFVLETLNFSSIDIANFQDEMIIREYEDYYDMYVESETQVSFYKIEKISGKIYDDGHEHFIPPPSFENEPGFIKKENINRFEEVRWDEH